MTRAEIRRAIRTLMRVIVLAAALGTLLAVAHGCTPPTLVPATSALMIDSPMMYPRPAACIPLPGKCRWWETSPAGNVCRTCATL